MSKFSLHKKILLTLLTGTLVISFSMPVLAAHRGGPSFGGPPSDQSNDSRKRPSHSSSSVSRPQGRPSGPANRPVNHAPGPNRPDPGRPPGMNRPSGPANRPVNHGPGPNRPGPGRPSGMNRPSGPANRPVNHGPSFHRPGPGMHPPMGHGPARPPHFGHRPRHGHPRDVFFHFGWSNRYYGWGRSHRLYFGDYLLLVFLLQAINNTNNYLTMDELYYQRSSGASYEAICGQYNLSWPNIYNRARLNYNDMYGYALAQDLSFLDWGDSLVW